MATFLTSTRDIATRTVLGAVLAATPALAADNVSGEALGRASADPDAQLSLIVLYDDEPGLFQRSEVESLGGQVGAELASIDGLAVTLPASALGSISDAMGVRWVTVDARVRANSILDVARVAVGVTEDTSAPGGPTGYLVGVAVVDSGVNHHADFGNRLLTSVDFTGSGSTADEYGHGTMVAGLIAGNGYNSEGYYRGVAPEASVVSLKVLDAAGEGRTSDVIRAIEWAVDHKNAYGIDLLNLSLGHPSYEAASEDPLVRAVESAWEAGITVVCAVGNDTVVESPATSSKVIAVGAIDDRGTEDKTDDVIATGSAVGPTPFDGFAKPELYAPGVGVASLRAAGSTLDAVTNRVFASGESEASYAELHGTSAAAAFVTGALASLMSDEDRDESDLDPDELKAELVLSTDGGSLNVDLMLNLP